MSPHAWPCVPALPPVGAQPALGRPALGRPGAGLGR
jgi:hypothetical protein